MKNDSPSEPINNERTQRNLVRALSPSPIEGKKSRKKTPSPVKFMSPLTLSSFPYLVLLAATNSQ